MTKRRFLSIRRELPTRAVRALGLLACVVLIAGISACDFQIVNQASGSIEIDVRDDTSKTLVPDVSLQIASYDIHGAGPAGDGFDLTNPDGNTKVDSLVPGEWTITVDARNADGIRIGTGQSMTTVGAGETVPLAVTVEPIEGYGAVEVVVSWDSGTLIDPSVSVTLVAQDGTETSLGTVQQQDGSYRATKADVANGAYTIVVQLFDGGSVAAGEAAAAQVVTGVTTSGNFAFSSVKPNDNSISVSIVLDMDDPLTVALSGTQAELDAGTSMTTTASVSGTSQSVNYSWYLDGEPVGTGDTYSTPTSLAAGTYDLSVVATTSGDGAGSTRHSFTVLAGASSAINAPTDLKAVEIAPLSENGIRLSWIDNSDNETSFSIERRQGDGVYAEIARAAAGAETYSDMGPSISIASATASSYDTEAGGFPPEQAIDNDLATRWSAFGDGEWIQLDLGSSQDVSSVGLAYFVGDERTSSFDIEVSDDAATWTPVLTGRTTSGTTLQTEYYQFTTVTGRYVRVVGHGNSSSLWNSITEIEIHRPVDLTSATTYVYRLRAVSGGSVSAYSNTATVTTQ